MDRVWGLRSIRVRGSDNFSGFIISGKELRV
jgi:hypothetical protein